MSEDEISFRPSLNWFFDIVRSIGGAAYAASRLDRWLLTVEFALRYHRIGCICRISFLS